MPLHRFYGFAWIFLFATRAVLASPLLTETEFSRWFEAFQDPKATVSAAVAPELAAFHYVFVPGLMNESFRPFYYRGVRSELKQLGVPQHQLHRFAGSSFVAVEKNAPKLFRFLEKLVEKDPSKKFVLTGHSKGSAEIMAMALQHAEFMREHSQASFLIQGAIRGSGVANYLLGTGVALDEKVPQPVRTMLHAARLLAKPLLPLVSEGLGSVGHEVATPLMARLLEEHPEAPALLDNNIFYVRSAKTPESQWDPIAWSGFYLDSYYGRGDWRVTLEDQHLPGVGRHLLLAEAHHDDFVGPNFTALFPSRARNLRRSLARSMATAVAYHAGNCSLGALAPQH